MLIAAVNRGGLTGRRFDRPVLRLLNSVNWALNPAMLVVQLVQRQDRIFWLYPGTCKPTQLPLFLDFHKARIRHNIQDLLSHASLWRHIPNSPAFRNRQGHFSGFAFWSIPRRALSGQDSIVVLISVLSKFTFSAGADRLWLDMAISNPS